MVKVAKVAAALTADMSVSQEDCMPFVVRIQKQT